MNPESDRLYREGVTAIRAGDKATAREKLMKAVDLDSSHEQAWLWLSAAVEKDEDRIVCLQNVLTLNPNNEAARKGLLKLGASTAVDVNPAGVHEEPPPPRIPKEPLQRMEHGASPAAREVLQSPKTDDDSWRKAVYSDPPIPKTGSTGSYATLAPNEPIGERNLLDLMDGWVAAIRFDLHGAYAGEMRVASLGRWLFNISIAGTLAGLGQILTLLLALTLQGMTVQGYLDNAFAPLREQRMEVPTIEASALLVALLLFTVFGTMFGLFFTQIMTHIATTSALGGKGSFVETLHAMSIADVATRIVGLVPAIIAGVVPGLSVVLSLAMWVYGLAMNVMAISSAHRDFGIGKSIGALFIGWVFLFVFVCCAAFVLPFLLAFSAQ